MIPINSFFYDFKNKIEELHGYEKERFVNIFWQKIYNMKVPLILRPDNEVIFLVRNRYEQINIIGDFNGWGEGETLQRINGTDIAYFIRTFPSKSAIEYKFKIGSNFFLDSLNNHKSTGYFGENSLLMMPHYKRNEELEYKEGATGELIDFIIHSKYLGYYKQINVYIPSEYDPSKKYDCLFFLDGENYLKYGNMVTILDNLIGQNKISPVLAFFIETKDYKNEFLFNNDHSRFFIEELIPNIIEKFNITEKRIIIGNDCSGIGIMNILAIQQGYDAILQSVPFSVFHQELKTLLQNGIKGISSSTIIIQKGKFEYPYNDSLKNEDYEILNFFESKFNIVDISVFQEGHCWNNWSNHIIEAIKKWDMILG